MNWLAAFGQSARHVNRIFSTSKNLIQHDGRRSKRHLPVECMSDSSATVDSDVELNSSAPSSAKLNSIRFGDPTRKRLA